MTEPVQCPRPPAAGVHHDLAVEQISPSDALYRVYRGADPTRFGRRTAGGNRFDPLPSPWGNTRVLYAGSSPEVAISETILRWQDQICCDDPIILPPSAFTERRLIQLRVRKPVTIIDMTGFGLGNLLPLTAPTLPDHIFVSNRSQYSRTQAWGAWFRTQLPSAAGLRWVSRQHNRSCAYVFFEDVVGAEMFELVATPDRLDTPGSPAYQLLQRCVVSLGWTLDMTDPDTETPSPSTDPPPP